MAGIETAADKKARDFYREWCAPEDDQPPCCKGNQYR
jgi:hypothetical protein